MLVPPYIFPPFRSFSHGVTMLALTASATLFFFIFVSFSHATIDWESSLVFCGKRAMDVSKHEKCKWMRKECYKNNEKYAAKISAFMCTTTFSMRKLSEFCCNESLEELREIVKDITGCSR
ncbi:hypothetical protein PMAYCL1PPCAC_31076, partial [Pristionchus mayeri]